jgi:hypothetical protein
MRDRNLATHVFFKAEKLSRCDGYYITGSDSTSSALEERMIRTGL